MRQPTRRDFLRLSTAAGTGVALGLSSASRLLGAEMQETAPSRSLEVLVLGGTVFLGPAIVEYARSRKHTVTLFNRGRTNPGLFEDLEKLRGDRDPRKGKGLKALEGRAWDVVIDTSGYFPRLVKASAERLADSVDQYIFISSISVFGDIPDIGIDETYRMATIEDESVEEITGVTYGPLKALCEKAVEQVMPGHATSIRPGLIVGYRDRSDRFTYWPVRVRRGGEVLAPGKPEDPVQFIDVRDLARFVVHCAEQSVAGAFNAVGPKEPLGMGGLLAGCVETTESAASFTWIDAGFLREQKVAPWSELPVWVPPEGAYAGFSRVSCAKAIRQGLTFRPLSETVKETLAWYDEREQKDLRAGLAPDREKAVLAAWHEHEEKKDAGEKGESDASGESGGDGDAE